MKAENAELLISVSELRDVNSENLKDIIFETTQKLNIIIRNENYGRKFEPLKPHVVRGYKKLIARCKTILRERSLNYEH